MIDMKFNLYTAAAIVTAATTVGCLAVGLGVSALWNIVFPAFGLPELSWVQGAAITGLLVLYKFVGAAAAAYGSPRQKPSMVVVSAQAEGEGAKEKKRDTGQYV